MIHPIFEALKRGERFPVSTLINEYDSVKLYWEWWWSQTSGKELLRPQTVADDDVMLKPTKEKMEVDTETYRDFSTEFAIYAQAHSELRRGLRVSRQDYRDDLIRICTSKAASSEPPTVVLAGGGYGAGKTTIVDFLMRAGKLPVRMGGLTGVDHFKAYLPEYGLLQRLAEGRASTVVQEESRLLADRAFDKMLESRLTFGWDSSLSNKDESMRRILKAKDRGYKTVLVAVFSPLELAIERAMSRARQIRRFAHPDFLPKSHSDFARCWMS